eukprot:TRINITY_DN40466_c0_g1_i1.p1 TRINITY_DN40466_c0_g1~~TRINITY_DN40466_c0_g1_i1.p1  ORF type:complete len:1124 (-),score=145.74 TRINITY_DN40466_c0_g1_i1:188-3526(-)
MVACIGTFSVLGISASCFLSLVFVSAEDDGTQVVGTQNCGLVSSTFRVVKDSLWETKVPCNIPLQTDCTSFEEITTLCNPMCPYAVQHQNLACVFVCVEASMCSVVNPSFAFPNNVSHACEPCNVVGCQSCSSRTTCTKCFDGFLLSSGGGYCSYIWDSVASDGALSGGVLLVILLMLFGIVVVIVDRCPCCGHVLPDDEDNGVMPLTHGEYRSINQSSGDRFSAGSQSPSGSGPLEDASLDPLERAVDSGKRHRSRCKIRDFEDLQDSVIQGLSPRNSQQVSACINPRTRLIPFWANLQDHFLVGVGLPLYHQWFPFLIAWSLMMSVGAFLVHHFSTFSKFLQRAGLDYASQVLLGVTSQDLMVEPFHLCGLSGESTVEAAEDYTRRATIGYGVLWVLGVILSMAFAWRQRRIAEVFYKLHPSLAEFALNIEGFPPEAIDEHKIRRFLRETLNCESLEVSICYDYRHLGQRVLDLTEKIIEYEDVRIGAYDADLAATKSASGELTGLTQADKTEILTWLEPGASVRLRNGGSVFAIFPHFYDLQNAKQMLMHGNIGRRSSHAASSRATASDGEPSVPRLPHQTTPEWLFLKDSPLVWVGENGRMHNLTIRDVVCEPTDVIWEYIGVSTGRFVCGLFLVVVAIVGSFLVMCAVLLVPLALYSLTYVSKAGNIPHGIMMTVLGTLGMTGNWLICLLHIFLSSMVGFSRADREGLVLYKAFSVLCLMNFLFGLTINCIPKETVMGDLESLVKPYTQQPSTLQDIAKQAEVSVQIFHMLVPGGLFIGYIMWPFQGHVWPLVSTLTTLNFWHKRTCSGKLYARSAERALEPLGLSIAHDYMGSVVQPATCVIAIYFASGMAWQLFLCLAGWALFMIPFQRYCHLRGVRRRYHTTNRLDTEVLFAWGGCLSMVLAASVFWACRLHKWSLLMVPLVWLGGWLFWGFLLAFVVRPMSLPKVEVHAYNRPTYDEVRSLRLFDWHNCNPIKVLLSHCGGDMPISPFQIGKEYLQISDPNWIARKEAAGRLKKPTVVSERRERVTASASAAAVGFFSSFPGFPEVETLVLTLSGQVGSYSRDRAIVATPPPRKNDSETAEAVTPRTFNQDDLTVPLSGELKS